MDEAAVLKVLHDVVDAVAEALRGVDDPRLPGRRRGQYALDLAADAAAVPLLDAAGLGVLSEESGLQERARPLLAVIDPVDGSTNASRGVPWFATSICVLDESGPWVAVVGNQASGRRYEAVRGGGATCDGRPLRPSEERDVGGALVALSGYPPPRPPWAQSRMLGAAALDLCAVAEGVLDGYVDCVPSALGAWDYLGALLVCREAGVPVVDAAGRDLVVRTHEARRTPVAAATGELLEALLANRSSLPL